jgi:prepilin-type N-terminal cleavage/methylation domain-containing protein
MLMRTTSPRRSVPHPIRLGRRESGFTLIELSVTMVILSVLLAISIGGFTKYRQAQDQRGSAFQVEEVLRNAQSRAQAEGITYCVTFNVAARSWNVYRSTCGTGTLVFKGTTTTPKVTLTTPTFLQTDGSYSASAQFTPRGTATPGSVKVTRPTGSKVYTIQVEGLTSRVSVIG